MVMCGCSGQTWVWISEQAVGVIGCSGPIEHTDIQYTMHYVLYHIVY